MILVTVLKTKDYSFPLGSHLKWRSELLFFLSGPVRLMLHLGLEEQTQIGVPYWIPQRLYSLYVKIFLLGFRFRTGEPVS